MRGQENWHGQHADAARHEVVAGRIEPHLGRTPIGEQHVAIADIEKLGTEEPADHGSPIDREAAEDLDGPVAQLPIQQEPGSAEARGVPGREDQEEQGERFTPQQVDRAAGHQEHEQEPEAQPEHGARQLKGAVGCGAHLGLEDDRERLRRS